MMRMTKAIAMEVPMIMPEARDSNGASSGAGMPKGCSGLGLMVLGEMIWRALWISLSSSVTGD